MDKRVKYSIKQKRSVVLSVLSGRLSVKGAARKLGCHKSGVQRWVTQYQQEGTRGFQFRNGHYSGPVKLRVVRYHIKKGLSLRQTACHFNIPNESTVYRWLNTYEHYGAEGLLKKNKGRKRSPMAKKPKKKEPTSSDPVAEKLAALQRENEYLRAENAFLKKLEALAQEEKAAKAQARRQKPFGN